MQQAPHVQQEPHMQPEIYMQQAPHVQQESRMQPEIYMQQSVLRKRPDFYQPLNEETRMGFSEGAAEHIIFAAFKKYQNMFEEDKMKANIKVALDDKMPKSIAQPKAVNSAKNSTSPSEKDYAVKATT